MTEQNPMYRNPEILDRTRHADLRYHASRDYSFAGDQGTVPITVGEFVEAAAHYPLLFIRNTDGLPMPLAATGLALASNDFVNGDGQWREGTYVPAYVRRYPFTFTAVQSAEAEEQQLVLCVDRDAPHFTQDGVPLFETQADQTSVVDRALQFCNRFQQSYRDTEALCRHLDALDLFEERSFRVSYRTTDRNDRLLKGFFIISATALEALSGEDFLELRRRNYLPAIYAHLSSLRCLQTLAARLH